MGIIGIAVRTLAIALTVGTIGSAASAQSAEEFFHDKQMSMVISTGVGGGYDLMGRVIARHLSKHINGTPTIVPRNMGGAGHVRAANYMAHQAPKDGTTLATIGNTIALHQVIDGKGVQYDAGKFNWIGTAQATNINLYVWTKEGVRTLNDAKTHEVLLGATGAGGGNEIYPALLNNTLGTKFRVIAGYGTGSDIHLAMQRGEVDGRAGNSFASLAASNADWLRDKTITVLVQFGLTPERGFESIPNLLALARNDTERAIFKLFSAPSALGWPVTAPPQVPAERVTVLRRAFDAMIKDPEFLAEAQRLRLTVSAVNGETLQKIVRDTVTTPPAIIEAAKVAITAKDVVKGSVAKPGGANGSE
jgi:tripartite-type tricarboxylate transporter receptor subunit TctC